jgi:hypothetical protein
MVDQLQIRLAGSRRDDSDVATAIAHVLDWNVQVPERKVQARVEGGWVTLKQLASGAQGVFHCSPASWITASIRL